MSERHEIMADKKPATKKITRYYIVNPAGAIHEVTREHMAERLKHVGYRPATEPEIAAYKGARLQRFDRPIAKPHSTEPEGVVEDAPEGLPEE